MAAACFASAALPSQVTRLDDAHVTICQSSLSSDRAVSGYTEYVSHRSYAAARLPNVMATAQPSFLCAFWQIYLALGQHG